MSKTKIAFVSFISQTRRVCSLHVQHLLNVLLGEFFDAVLKASKSNPLSPDLRYEE